MGRLEGALVGGEQAAMAGVDGFSRAKVVAWKVGCALPSVMAAKLKP